MKGLNNPKLTVKTQPAFGPDVVVPLLNEREADPSYRAIDDRSVQQRDNPHEHRVSAKAVFRMCAPGGPEFG